MVKKGASADVSKTDDRDKQITDLQAQVATLQKENESLKTINLTPVASSQPSSQTSSQTSQPVGKININTATAAQLESLPGIGPTYAKRIIEYRTANGGFKAIDQIQNIKGIGAKTYAKFKDLITI